MLKRGLVLVLFVAMTSSVFAGATIQLVVTDRGNTPCNGIDGCVFNPIDATQDFLGGEELLVHVLVTTDRSFQVRGAQIDWRASSRELGLGEDVDTINQGIDGIPNFWFDYSPILNIPFPGFEFPQGTYGASGLDAANNSTAGNYTDFSNLQQGPANVDFVASTIWASTTASPFPFMLQLEAGMPYRLGGMLVTLPSARGGAAEYTFDVLNAEAQTTNDGMSLDFGFGTSLKDGSPDPNDLVTKWSSVLGAGDDSITYADGSGPLTLRVIPEPATLILLGLGGLAAIRRRRK
ncbi:MAG: PEP-CTERM sorting domain-containing protein [Planctomycetes bacterium]|nr:PEP-CTERM sorting domain-containing protein [Planctomycetota bacterium]